MTISDPARVVLQTEVGLQLPASAKAIETLFTQKFAALPGQLRVFAKQQWTAPIASGSAHLDAMVVCPCSSATLAAIATGASRSLTERAADVVIKEQRKLILVVRETPLSAIHLEHMLKLARLGVTIMAASPAFYHQPKNIEDIVDFMVSRMLDHIGIANDLIKRWQ